MEGILGSAFPMLYVPEEPQEATEAETADAIGVDEPAAADAGAETAEPEASMEPDRYTTKINKITNRFEKMRSSADELEQYLQTAEKVAKESEFKALAQADDDFTPAWRSTGLPMKPSHLRLDTHRMEGGRLVNPKAIMTQYQGLRTKEVLNPPRIYEYNDTSIEPNYLKMTGTLTSRNSMIPAEKMTRVQEASLKSRTWNTLSADEVKQKIQDSEDRRKKQDAKMPSAQYELEKKVIKNMNQKLSFLRNPRYPLPPAVKMLQSQFKDMDAKKPPIKANMTAHPENVFVSEPGVVTFTDYVVGEVYSRCVRIRNVTNVARNLRCFPPASQYFHMSLLRFPQDKGIVAPGMAAEVTIRFCPDSLADYDDQFAIDTAMARFLVPIEARRPPPSLNLPPVIDIGEVLAGNKKVLNVSFSNAGGAGRFRIIPEHFWPHDYASAPADVAQVGPFQVWPLFFNMQAGDEVALSLGYEPQSVGRHEERLLIVCDNCQVNSFLLKGTSTTVDIVMDSIDGRAVESGKQPAAPIWFGEVVPESVYTRKLCIKNTTSLPFSFEWTMSSYPQTQPSHAFNAPDGDGMMASTGDRGSGMLEDRTHRGLVADGGGDPSLAAATAAQIGSGAYGRVDLVALGEAPDRELAIFFIEPRAGVVQAGEGLDFSVTFVPSETGRVERWATLKVDRSTPGTAPQGCNVTVLEVGLEGLGIPLVLEVLPRRTVVPGSLTPGQLAASTIIVRNPTRAPAIFSFESADPDCKTLVHVSPSSGMIQPLKSIEVLMTLTAPEEPGPHLTGLSLNVANGPPILVEMLTTVGPPRVEFCSSVLNFGLVQLNATCTLPLKIRNASLTCTTNWSVKELRAALSPPNGCTSSSADTEPPYTHLTFYPEGGSLGAGEETVIRTTLRALSDGPYRSTVQLHAPGGEPCISTVAFVVTPTVGVSPPIISLGSAYVGVQIKKSVQIRNLSLLPLQYDFSVESPLADPLAELKIRPSSGNLNPGELQEIHLRYTPKTVGHSVIMGVCDITGAPNPTGFVITSDIQDLDVMYELLSESEYVKYKAKLASGKKKRNDVENFDGMAHLPPDVLSKISVVRSPGAASTPFPPGDKHFTANFGKDVPLGETRSQFLIITNRTPMHTMVRTWLDHFGVDDASKLVKKERLADGKGDTGGNFIRSSKYTPIKLSDEAEKTRPFRSDKGNDMMATRRLLEDSETVLGAKGLAVNVSPPVSTLGPWCRLEMQVACFNDMCGDYFDMLHVKVGELPVKDIPVRIGVAGTPLVVQRDRVLIKGLKERSWRTSLEFGQIPVGVNLDRTFYVFNTGGLDMHLSWEFRRFQDESDFDRPGAKVVELNFNLEEPPPTPKMRRSSAGSEHSHGLRPRQSEVGEEGTAEAAASAEGTEGAAGKAAAAPEAGASTGDRAAGEAAKGEEEASKVLEPKEPEWRGKLHLNVNTHAEPDVAPYVVEPREKVLKGGESAMFTVNFVSDRSVPHQGYLHGTQKVFSTDSPLELKIWPEGEKADGLGLMFSKTFHPYAGYPPSPLQPLRVDLQSTGVVSRLEPDNNTDLQFVCHSVNKAASHGSYKQVVTMSNRQTCPLIFSMRADGPFQLLSTTPSAPQDPIMYSGTTGTLSSFGGKTYLPARETVDVELQFCPPKKDNFIDYHMSGDLVAEFANGDVQVLPLEASVLHPQAMVKPSSLEYGRVHVQSPKPLIVILSNPSEVDAYWAVTSDSSTKPKFFSRPEELAPGGLAGLSEARVGSFIIRPAGGLLPGRGLGLPRTQHVTVTFAPSEAKSCSEQLLFAVLKGRTCTLSMTGTGSFDERDEHQAKLFGI